MKVHQQQHQQIPLQQIHQEHTELAKGTQMHPIHHFAVVWIGLVGQTKIMSTSRYNIFVSILEKLYLTLDFRLNVIAEKHGVAAGMVVLNVESKICLMMLTWFTMRITKRWPLMDQIHSIVTLADPLSYTNKLLAITYLQ